MVYNAQRFFSSLLATERLVLWAALIILSWYNLALSLIEKNAQKMDFVGEEFLHKKINNKDAYEDYGATENILENVWN